MTMTYAQLAREIATLQAFAQKQLALEAKGAIAKFNAGSGNQWGGRGPRPAWLRNASAAGRTLASFAIGAEPASVASATSNKPDWRGARHRARFLARARSFSAMA